MVADTNSCSFSPWSKEHNQKAKCFFFLLQRNGCSNWFGYFISYLWKKEFIISVRNNCFKLLNDFHKILGNFNKFARKSNPRVENPFENWLAETQSMAELNVEETPTKFYVFKHWWSIQILHNDQRWQLKFSENSA